MSNVHSPEKQQCGAQRSRFVTLDSGLSFGNRKINATNVASAALRMPYTFGSSVVQLELKAGGAQATKAGGAQATKPSSMGESYQGNVRQQVTSPVN